MGKGLKHQIHPILPPIPAAESGEYAIVQDPKPPGATFWLASDRTVIFGGHKGGSLSFPEPTVWHKLTGPAGVWMTDLPIEQIQMLNEIKPIRAGRVLVGGLGLGIVARWLANRPKITEVVVVEISKDVVNLVGPSVQHPKITVVNADIFDYLDTVVRPFRWAYYDIWQDDGEWTFFETVCPLLKESTHRVVNKPICWNESVMRGQLMFSLQSRGRFAMVKMTPTDVGEAPFPMKSAEEIEGAWEDLATEKDSIFWDWQVPFWRACRERWIREGRSNPFAWMQSKRLLELMNMYLAFYPNERVLTGLTRSIADGTL